MDASRFDALARSLAGGLSRRRLAKLLAALGLGGALPGRAAPAAAARWCKQCCSYERLDIICYCCGSGIAGAGVVRTPGAGAAFALFASRLEGVEANEAIRGHLWWEQPNGDGPGLTLASSRIDAYGPLPGQERGREVRGLARVDGREGVPFLLHAVAGAEGGGEDRVWLWVGDAIPGGATPPAGTTGFGYAAEGPVAVGRLALLRFDQPAEGEGTAESGTPAA